MSMTPEQMQAMYAQRMAQRQQMEQQWADMQGAYSGLPGAPTNPMMSTMEVRPPGYQAPRTMEEAMRQRYAAAQQPQSPWQPAQPAQNWAIDRYVPPAAGTPAPTGSENMVRTMELTPEQYRQQREQQWAKMQGAYSSQPGAPVQPVQQPMMQDQRYRGRQNAYARGARGAGLINQMNARDQDPYAGQNLTPEQRQVAQANQASIQAQQPATPATPAQPAQQPTQKWTDERYTPPAAGTPAPTGDEQFTKMKTMYEQRQPRQPTV